jgi:hypothetical protein
MKAISIRQPWAWLIVQGHKTIENRSWPTRLRGPVLIHASKTASPDDALVREWVRTKFGIVIPAVLDRGGIVGQVEIIDCVSTSSDPWFEGLFGFALRRAKPLPFRPLAGKLSFFEV